MHTHRAWIRPTFALAAGALAVLAPSAADAAPPGVTQAQQGLGLRVGDHGGWSRWQGRLGLVDANPATLSGGRFDPAGAGLPRQRISLFGDYYFLQQGLAPASRYGGGFRATGGIILGSRGLGWPTLLPGKLSGLGSGFDVQRHSLRLGHPLSDGSDMFDGSASYLGIGYTGLSSLDDKGGGWGFSADLGVMALQPRSAIRLGQPSLDDALRELRWSPLLQLGVSYSF